MISTKVAELERENEELRELVGKMKEKLGDPDKMKNCEYCEHFVQHYIRCGSSYVPMCSGHCVAGARVKRNKKTDETCKSFERKRYGKNLI